MWNTITEWFANNIDWNNVLTALGIMGKGMLGIFVVIIVIWGLVALLNKVTGSKTAQ